MARNFIMVGGDGRMVDSCNPRNARKILIIVALCILGIAYTVWIGRILRNPYRYQWDFKTYYYAHNVFRKGLSPYKIENLSAEAGEEVEFPFIYPYPVLYFFRIFSRYPYTTAYYLFFSVKVLSLLFLLVLWRSILGCSKAPAFFFLFSLLAYEATVAWDLKSGNVVMIEQAILWIGFTFILRRKPLLAGLAILLASLFKVTPIFFLPLLFLSGTRKRAFVYICLSILLFAIFFLVSYALDPENMRLLIANMPYLEPPGAHNPCSLSLFKDFELLLQKSTFPPAIPFLSYILYSLHCTFVLVFSIKVLRKSAMDKKLFLFYSCLLYALLMPRFKTYSYILLIPTSWYFLREIAAKYKVNAEFLLLGAIMLPEILLGPARTYYPFFLTYLLWLSFSLHLRSIGGRTGEPRITTCS